MNVCLGPIIHYVLNVCLGPKIHYVLNVCLGPIIEKDFVKLMENNGFKVNLFLLSFNKKSLKRLKRVKDKMKHKECQKSVRIKKMLKNARFE